MKKAMKYKKKWGIISILTVFLGGVMFTGCRLAKEESVCSADNLIGMLVTTDGPKESDDLQEFDEEEKLEGRKTEEGWCEFPQVAGAAIVREYDAEDDTVSVQGPEGSFSDIHMEADVSDAGEKHKYSGVFHISADFDGTLYFCPVYEREDGSVYAVMTGDRYDFEKEYFPMGATISKSVEEEETVTWDGKKAADSISFTVHVKREMALKEFTLLEMRDSHEVICSTKVTEDQDSIKLQPETAYATAEMICRDMNGGETVVHTVYDPDGEENYIMRPYEDGNHLIYWKNLYL